MKLLKVNFAAKRRLPAWPMYMLSVLMAAIAAWKAVELVDLHKEIRQREAALQSARQQLAEQRERIRAASTPVAPPYAEDAWAVVRQRQFPLDGVFASLEHTAVPGVRLVSLDISPPEGVAKVELEFGDQDSLLRYVDAINAGEPPLRWSLVRMQAQQPAGNGTATIQLKKP